MLLPPVVQHVKLFEIGVVNFKDSRTSRWLAVGFLKLGSHFRSVQLWVLYIICSQVLGDV